MKKVYGFPRNEYSYEPCLLFADHEDAVAAAMRVLDISEAMAKEHVTDYLVVEHYEKLVSGDWKCDEKF